MFYANSVLDSDLSHEERMEIFECDRYYDQYSKDDKCVSSTFYMNELITTDPKFWQRFWDKAMNDEEEKATYYT